MWLFTFLLKFVIFCLFEISLQDFLIKLKRAFFKMVKKFHFLSFSFDTKTLFRRLLVHFVIRLFLFRTFKISYYHLD